MIGSEAAEIGCPRLSRRSFVQHTAILDGQVVDQPTLAGHRVAVGVAELEIAVAQLDDRDVGFGSGPQGTDRAFQPRDSGRPSRRSEQASSTVTPKCISLGIVVVRSKTGPRVAVIKSG